MRKCRSWFGGARKVKGRQNWMRNSGGWTAFDRLQLLVWLITRQMKSTIVEDYAAVTHDCMTRDAFERQYRRDVTRACSTRRCHTIPTVIMSSFAQHGNDGEEIQPPQRPPSPPPHTTFAVRGVHVRLASPSTFERCSHDRRSVS